MFTSKLKVDKTVTHQITQVIGPKTLLGMEETLTLDAHIENGTVRYVRINHGGSVANTARMLSMSVGILLSRDELQAIVDNAPEFLAEIDRCING